MELKQLKYFEIVAREGSLSRASAILGVSQSMLTRHVQTLEQTLGVSLLYRTGHGMQLTDVGKKFLIGASDIVNRSDTLANQMQALRSIPGGTVTMGMPPMLGEFLSVPLTQRFRIAFPEVRLTLRESFSGYLLEWLMTGQLDISVLYNASTVHTVNIEPLLSDQMLLIGAPGTMPGSDQDESIPFAQTIDLPWILPARPHGLRTLAENAALHLSSKLNIAIEIDAMVAILDLVEAGEGFSIAPYAAVSRRIERGTLEGRPIVDPTLSGVLSIAFSPRKEATLAMKALYRIVREETDALVRKGIWRTAS
ncbi:LysR family transcriptional regulator [Robbsia sp. KACC 23696]|uniref:LysR family transcriptional regulator n=1 Tax=Robbsia sp. KACC 23696 TaxID=3149231 RepID=UPI00325A4B44